MLRRVVQPILAELARLDRLDCEDGSYWQLFRALTRESLDFDPVLHGSRASGINNDGSPWQFCVVLGSRAATARYLTEIGEPCSPMSRRAAFAEERLREIGRTLGFPERSREVTGILFDLLPRDESDWAPLNAGVWVGVAPSPLGPRLRVYTNTGWGGERARWERIARALRAAQARGASLRLRTLIPELLPAFSPSGLAVTIPSDPPIWKLYLRPRERPWPGIASVLTRARIDLTHQRR